MSSKLFICDAFREYIMSGVIDLNSDTLKAALVTSSQVTSYSTWAANTAYTVGDIRVPTTDNGHRYICTVAGTSHATTEPIWPTGDGGEITDGTVTWEEYGGALANNSVWADASANEVASGDGYTTGGATIAGNAISYDKAVGTWDANDVVWSSLTKTFRFGYIYKSGTVGSVTNPLIGYILFDDTPDDVSVSAIDFTIRWNASGIYLLQ